MLESVVDEEWKVMDIIKQLKDVWFKIALDDFWSGRSNFMRLFEMKPDFVKMDWSLIKWINNDKKKVKAVKAFYDFAKALWADVIAEFVEDEEVQKVLDIIWIEYSQGYLFSKPSEKLIWEE